MTNPERRSFNADGVTVYTQTAEVVGLGDKVAISGNLEKRVTDRKNRQYRLINPTIVLIEDVSELRGISGYKIWAKLGEITDSIWLVIQGMIDYPYSGLVAGILLGLQTSLSTELVDALKNTGTIHIVSASGYNVSIISIFSFNFFLRLFKRKTAIVFALLAVWGYVCLGGATVPLVRAGIMGALLLLAQVSGREYTALWALGLTAGLMLGFKPQLIQSVSFLLSVSATLGILTVSPRLKQCFIQGRSLKFWQNRPRWQRAVIKSGAEDLAATAGAIIATLPIILIVFDSFNFVALPANLAVLWTIPPIMLLTMLALEVNALVSWLSPLVGWLIYPYAWWFVRVIEIANTSTRLKVEDLHLSWWFGFGYYFILLAFGLYFDKKADK